MRLNIKDNKRLWYLVFAVCLTVLLIYIKFPSEALINYIRVEAEKRYTDINIDFDKADLTIPAGIKIQGLRISLKEDPDTPVYVSEKSSVRVSVTGWLTGGPKYYFASTVNGGTISGFLEEKKEGEKERIEASIDIEDVKLDENIFIHPVISQRIEGTLTCSIKFIGDIPDFLRGNVEVSLDLVDGRFYFKKPFLDMDTMEFKKISMSGILDNRKLDIKDLSMTGQHMNGNATGTVQISNNFPDSRLNIKTEIEPLPSLYRQMPRVGKLINALKNKKNEGKLQYNIQGTIDSPIPIPI